MEYGQRQAQPSRIWKIQKELRIEWTVETQVCCVTRLLGFVGLKNGATCQSPGSEVRYRIAQLAEDFDFEGVLKLADDLDEC